MREILIILASAKDGMYRYDLVYALEKDNWVKKTRQCCNASWRIPIDSIRVSYDRTLSQLIGLGLIDGFYSKEIPKSSPYYGTLWKGRCFKLTEKGRIRAEEIIDNTLEPVARFNELILNGFNEPKRHWLDLTTRCPHCRKILEKCEITEAPVLIVNPHIVFYKCARCGETFGLWQYD
jgi:DNA-directed RNA polymerase subunit RPC12/RpoP